MKTLYKKSELWFALAWIAAYCVFMSLGDNLSAHIGITDAFTLPIAAVLSIVLFLFLKNNDLLERYGLCRSTVPAARMLFYIPILIFLTDNLWHGIALNISPLETVLYILTMLFVGFLEEMIFRGFLFRALLNDGVKSAVIVSSVTFGMGHIVRLFNGSGGALLPNLLRVIYAIAIGFMFVMIYYKTKSMIPCILAHSIFNALSVFANEAVLTTEMRILSCVFLVLLCGSYALYIALAVNTEPNEP